MIYTDEDIFKSLYVLNKSAKKSRDTQKRAAKENNQRVAKAAKTRKDFIYDLKHLTMEKLIDEEKLKFIGIHKQEVNSSSFYLAFYKSSLGFSYHRPATKAEIKDYQDKEYVRMTVVPALQKHSFDFGYYKAVEILLDYLKMTKEDVKKKNKKQFSEQTS